jgi:uncharacterized membrane protein YhaH (DUF805 family)
MDWYLGVLRNYAVFHGRARRREYWMFALISFIVSLVLGIIDYLMRTNVLGVLYTLAILIPSLAVHVRRLHDTNRSAWWLLIGLIPLIGAIVLLVFTLMDSDPGDNDYGPNPKEFAA